MNCICPEHVGPPIPPPTIRSPLAQGVPPSTAYGGSTLGWCARDQDAQATPTLSGGNHPPPRHRGHRTHRPDPRRHPRDPHSAPRAPECRMPSCWQEQESATVLPTFDDKPHRTMLRERAATPQVEISAKRLTLAELRVVGAFAHLPRICYRVTPFGVAVRGSLKANENLNATHRDSPRRPAVDRLHRESARATAYVVLSPTCLTHHEAAFERGILQAALHI